MMKTIAIFVIIEVGILFRDCKGSRYHARLVLHDHAEDPILSTC